VASAKYPMMGYVQWLLLVLSLRNRHEVDEGYHKVYLFFIGGSWMSDMQWFA